MTDKLFTISEPSPSTRIWGYSSWIRKDNASEGALGNYSKLCENTFDFSLIPNINTFNIVLILNDKDSQRKYFIIESITFRCMLFFKYKSASRKPENSIFPFNRTTNQLEFFKYLLRAQCCRGHRKSRVIVSTLNKLGIQSEKSHVKEMQIVLRQILVNTGNNDNIAVIGKLQDHGKREMS